ncbi:glycine zipper 2TM domain-containing protein [Pseudoduganella buxea]|uniref:Glycine zipper 2TM domain-containing protein n=1 Tax=Pseudoduganella buxea TaxID=1949069 RepID=A0A6I3SUN7_9BURK|nr:glycine zipper 2TM domain-containing protein [Pseudoduganella buxea]MTV52891.1 glycine zipper 2TM domain-containing protein [Pseudoduganella buxea]GGC16334.1 hypothetical protein GCM10011572_42090 [Pseudoduganella buxea]
MEKIATASPVASRIHPLFAAAAVSVIALSGTGIAAMTGMLPSSKAQSADTVPMSLATQQAMAARQGLELQPLAAAQPAPQQLAPQALQQPALVLDPAPAVRQPAVPAQPERVVVREVVYREPAPRKVVREAPERSHVARHQQSAPAPAAQERAPNYVAIGTGAVVGGLLGNQVGDGNGKKLATLAGIIGGGYVGNEIANRNK